MLTIIKIIQALPSLLVISILLIIGSCSKSNKVEISSIEKLEKKERVLQKNILIKEMLKSSNRLQNIGWSILSKNADLCKKKSNYSFGITYVDILDLPKEDHVLYKSLFNKNIKPEFFKKYNIGSFPVIASVAKGSPAYAALLKKDDIILKINNKVPINFRILLNKSISNSPLLELQILRKNKILDIKLKGKKICNYNIQALPSGFPNAFADGKKIFITIAAIKLARTDDELAFLIGHELAHNIYDFNSKETSEAFTLVINYKDRPKIRELKNLFVWSSQRKEIRADVESVHLAYRGGYNLENINDYWRRLSVFNPELIEKSNNIYKGNAYRAALIKKTISKLKRRQNEAIK